ncbi:ribosomal protection-like ABC-F family protein [Clostridium felsineum]|uniref:Energy-dependent translational throttle protein EttA n=1 Tax=Clostridium felsineum TaxID=36839 RepID=A0A1S8M7C6_9CLOT|nr:ABC-F family ATP-binding cassette domain-containing protein [Clostridium felsineum]URZ01924.1 Energy-dependent translational throttle protein EttA [Clostridium felsineum]URZ05237.1 Energy-dependent translational throttle protein EttA [Clostridium felsineum]URZ10278.1 Energy-dependent translational throttle protein EttA [Clostridium felsineum]
MNLITLENISKSYGEKTLLNKISFSINEGEKIGLIGINGTGKSTLLKVLCNLEDYDSGNIITSNNLSMSYLSQNEDFHDDATILEQIFKGNSKEMKLLRDYETSLESSLNHPEDKNIQEQLLKLTMQMDALNLWNMESSAKTILTKLGIKNFNAKIKTLSGGQKKRVALAETLITPSNLIVLDEPTNHLDNETIEWLEQYLSSTKSAVFMITHDRYFLDRISNKIFEIHAGDLYTYIGNYSLYLEKKLEREQIALSSKQKKDNLLRRELAWIRRGAKARSTKQKARIQRFDKLSNEKDEIIEDKIDISTAGSRLGKKVIEIKDINKSFNDSKIIDNFSFIFSKGDRLGIVGANGIGKSTLLNMISGKTSPDSGIIDLGATVKLGYFSQEISNMDEKLRVIEYIKEGAEFIRDSNDELISASKMLEKFLFSPEMQWTPIAKLSGGERKRLYLLRILMEAPNVLILDEPTNDLDIQTLTILEDYLQDFEGTIITVSHDRYFLDKLANKLLIFKGNGIIDYNTGNYSDYLDKIKSEEVEVRSINSTKNKQTKPEKAKSSKLKFSFKEKMEYEKIDSLIEETENKLNSIEDKINSAGSDYMLLEDLMVEKKNVEENLQHLYDRWEYLNELAEKIKNN